MKWVSFLALFGCSSALQKAGHSQVMTGPFEIHCDIERTASGAWYNLGTKPGGENITSYFSVYHKGKPVFLPGNGPKASYFWQALFLNDAPKPAVLVGTHSMYLITDENGQAVVKSLHIDEGDFGKYQWLDSNNGQPGQKNQIYSGDDSQSSRYLSGGRYLLVNTRLVLDVKSLATYPIDINTSALVDQLDGFNAFNAEVAGFSPRQTQLVLTAFRRNVTTNHSEYALVAIDFVTNKAYAVPFDRTDCRFFSIWDATPAWLATYFVWTIDQTGKEKLVPRSFNQRPYWQGTCDLSQTNGRPGQYQLRPVLESIVSQFITSLSTQFKLAGIRAHTTGSLVITEFIVNDIPLTLYFNSSDKTLTLTCTNNLLIKTIGEKFDQELAKGKFQNDFGTFNYD